MRALDGDWHSWLDEHGPALLLLARQYVPDPADAEDVVQEAFVHFWRARHRAEDARSYLFACVRTCALEWLRGRKRRGRREEIAARPDLDRRSPLFESALFQDERRRAVESALAVLPAEQREVIVLKVWAGLSFAEIARALDVPANTAASRYRYALERLRRQLSEEMIA
jgi:RNA polymerase sigma factor (sigma-70 family)